MRFFGLTTALVVGRTVCGGDRRRTYKLLDSLVARGELRRHDENLGTYFTASPMPLSNKELERRFAVLSYCRLGATPRILLSPKDFKGILAGLANIVGGIRAPRFEPCVHSGSNLEILRVHPMGWSESPDGLNRALAWLQTYVSSPAFEAWSHFARHGLFTLTYLVPDEGESAELERWLARHPLLSYVSDSVLPISTRVAHVPSFPGCSRTNILSKL